MKTLDTVTLVSVTSVNIDETHRAMLHCLKGLEFARAVLLSSAPPENPDPRIAHVRIPAIDFFEYSRFMLKELGKHVDTDHCLVVQSDGFVVNPDLWNPEWLAYDYVGAPWPESLLISGNPPTRLALKNRVGNGGFSLRSRKLLRLSAWIDFDAVSAPSRSEDLLLCNHFYETMLGFGVRYAPLETAARFSIENPRGILGQSLGTTFGFHGKHLLPMALERVRRRP